MLALATSYASAQTLTYQQTVAQLNNLLKQKQYEQAYQLADNYTFEHGGLPEFDLLAGFAAYGSEHYQEAVFAFERVVLERPNSFLAHFYLAQTYRKLQNLPAAMKELDKLLVRPLLEEQRDKAQKLRDRIERQLINKKRTWGQVLSAGLFFDSNINSGAKDVDTYFRPPNAPETVVPIVELTETSSATRDMGYSLGYQGFYQHPISQYQWFKADVGLAHFDYIEHNQFRRNPISLSLSYEHQLPNAKASVSVFTRPLLIEGQDYRVENGLHANWNQNLSKQSGISAGLSYSLVTKDENGDQDFNRVRGNVSYFYRTQIIQAVSFHGYQDVSDNSYFEFNDKNVIGGMYQITWPLSEALLVSGNLLHEQHSYQGEHPWATDESNKIYTREETLSMLSTQLSFRTTKKMTLKLNLNLQHKTSNLSLFEFNRTELGATWLYEL